MQPQPQQPQIELRMITNQRELIQDVGRWAESQPWHPKHAPDYGCVEELGELCFGVLKNIQNIKGMGDIDAFRKHTLDALGDIMVFLSHWCYLNQAHYIPLPIERVIVPEEKQMRNFVGEILISLSQMFTIALMQGTETTVLSSIATRLTHSLQGVARMFGWDLMRDCLYPTWHRVRLRNFNKEGFAGGRDVIEAELGAPDASPRELPTATVDPTKIEGEKPLA